GRHGRAPLPRAGGAHAPRVDRHPARPQSGLPLAGGPRDHERRGDPARGAGRGRAARAGGRDPGGGEPRDVPVRAQGPGYRPGPGPGHPGGGLGGDVPRLEGPSPAPRGLRARARAPPERLAAAGGRRHPPGLGGAAGARGGPLGRGRLHRLPPRRARAAGDHGLLRARLHPHRGRAAGAPAGLRGRRPGRGQPHRRHPGGGDRRGDRAPRGERAGAGAGRGHRAGAGRSGRRGAAGPRGARPGGGALLPRALGGPAARPLPGAAGVTAERPLTILHLVANRWWTGSAEPVIRLLLGLRARGHRALLGLIPGDRFEQKAREAGLEPLAGLSLEVRGNPVHALADLRRVRQAVRAEDVDVVHAHHSHDHWLGWLGRGGAGLVRTFHNARAVRRDRPSTWLYRRTDALIAVSREIEERLQRVGIPPARLARVDGVVDLARFESGDGAAIRGFQQLLPEYPEARLLLVGKGEARDRLEAFVSGLGLTRSVLFAGYRDGDLPAVLQALDAFALMGAGSDESCRAALEAMA